jgi:nitrate reductase NapE component
MFKDRAMLHIPGQLCSIGYLIFKLPLCHPLNAQGRPQRKKDTHHRILFFVYLILISSLYPPMAEVFGIAAGAAGFLSLLIQIISGIDTLHDISDRANKAPAELASLINELEYLKRLMEEFVQRASRNDDVMLQMCHASCAGVMKDFEKLKKCIPTELKGTAGRQRLLRMFNFRHWKEDVEVLQRSIQSAKTFLIV